MKMCENIKFGRKNLARRPGIEPGPAGSLGERATAEPPLDGKWVLLYCVYRLKRSKQNFPEFFWGVSGGHWKKQKNTGQINSSIFQPDRRRQLGKFPLSVCLHFYMVYLAFSYCNFFN